MTSMAEDKCQQLKLKKGSVFRKNIFVVGYSPSSSTDERNETVSDLAEEQVNEFNHVKTHKIGIIMNGVTGRMGTNQHLICSIMAIIAQGGVKISEQETIMPVPVLVGRNKDKLS